jgi:N-acetylglucosaminyl-diphospho-decaprenol L-rhamnosyltransferase
MTARSLVIVNYFSAAHARRAIVSARNASSLPLQVIVVDNSCDAAEAAELQNSGADRIVISKENRGYAGGLNDGVAQATGEVLFLANPDLIVHSAALDLLAAALSGDVAMAGPRFCWDDAGDFTLPLPERPRPSRKRLEIAALTSRELASALDFVRFRARVWMWARSEATTVPALSGALMAIHRETYERLGGFDESFRLYFEEIDFMERALRQGLKLLYVPSAVCRHLYNQSASRDAAFAQRYVESELHFFEKWYGSSIIVSMKRGVAGRIEPPSYPSAALLMRPEEGDEQLVFELSPLADFSAAAGSLERRDGSVPREILESVGGQPLFARFVSRESGRVVSAARIIPGG